MRIRLLAFWLAVSGLLSAQSDAPPGAIQQQALVARIPQNAMRFRGQLPDFICTKLTDRWEDSSGSGNKWKHHDSLEETVYFSQGGRTAIKLLKLNGKPTNRTHENAGGLREDTLLADAIVPANIFGPDAPAQFEWSRWEMREGRRMAVLAFRVATSVKNYPYGKDAYLLGYRGLVYADPEDGIVMRLEVHDAPPPGYPFQESGWDVDYGPGTISGRVTVLPVKAVVHVLDGKLSLRNDIQFTAYRKFEADSTVTFENK